LENAPRFPQFPQADDEEEFIHHSNGRYLNSAYAYRKGEISLTNETPAAPTPREDLGESKLDAILPWLRRVTSLATWLGIVLWARGVQVPPQTVVTIVNDSVSRFIGIEPGRFMLAAAILWLLFLTRLQFRWIVGLPIYLVGWPIWWIALKVMSITVTPILWRLGFFGIRTSAPNHATAVRLRAGARFLWVATFVLWLLFLRGTGLTWSVWLPPILSLPLWSTSLRWAYRAAVSPRVFATSLTEAANALLDRQMKEFHKAVADNKKPPSGFAFYRAITGILSRYSDSQLLSGLQREALTYFSIALVGALAASSFFWGLIGYAMLKTYPAAMASYQFFQSGTLLESILWGLGCMTTSIGFPGEGAPLHLKLMHTAILATGIFQLTYLISSFGLFCSAGVEGVLLEARTALDLTRSKVKIIEDLEAQLQKTAIEAAWPDR
jgi:hypothetical protein